MSNTNKQIPNPKDHLARRIIKFPEYLDMSGMTDKDIKRNVLSAMKTYAKEVVKYTLDQAAENAEVEYTDGPVDKQSILSLESQIIKDLNL